MPRVFISHAWEDKQIARAIEKELQAIGTEIWIDHEGIRGGDNLPKRIADALEWCDTIVLIWSQAAAKSRWVKLEWTNAVALRKRILPILTDDARFPALLAHKVYIDFRNLQEGTKALLNLFQVEDKRTKGSLSSSESEKEKKSREAADAIKKRKKVFISYSHRNRFWVKRLQIHLKPLQIENAIEVWDDSKITPGLDWGNEIEKAIDSARVAILLFSADFLASDFIIKYELPRLLAAANERGAHIVPIIVSPCRFIHNQNLSRYKAVNDPSTKPLIAMNKFEREKLFVEVSEIVETAFGV